MGTNYEKGMYKQLQEVISGFEKLTVEVERIKTSHKWEMAALKETHRQEREAHRQEIAELKAAHQEEITRLETRIVTLEAENALLKARMNKDSGNSSKPPSSRGYKNLSNSREKTGRRPGGQPGHKGYAPKLCETPDEVIKLNEGECSCGGAVEYPNGSERRQHIELEIHAHVKEYQSGEGACSSCGKRFPKQFPEELPGIINIGETAKAVIALLMNEGAVSVNRTQRILSEVTEGRLELCEATLVEYQRELSEKLEGEVETIRQDLALSEVLHKDESGARINGSVHWLHVVSTSRATYYEIHPKRGSEADNAMGILPAFTGTLVHDHLKSLYDFPCTHAECNAHVLRYLKGVCENDKEFEPFAEALGKLLKEMNDRRKVLIEGKESAFPASDMEGYHQRYDEILTEWNALTREKETRRREKKQSGKYKSEAEPLGKRLLEYKEQHLLFLKDYRVPFDNNQAERDIRPAKTKLKVSGGFRSQSGARAYARIRSFISTLRKRQCNIFQGLRSVFAGISVLA